MAENITYILNPRAHVAADDERVVITVPSMLKKIELPISIRTVLADLEKPFFIPPGSSFHRALVDNEVIIPSAFSDLSFNKARNSVGIPLTLSRILEGRSTQRCVLFGVPYDARANISTRTAPDLIRSALQYISSAELHGVSLEQTLVWKESTECAYQLAQCLPHDLGNLHITDRDDLQTIQDKLTTVIGLCLENKMTPIILGGEHLLTGFAVEACASRYPGIGYFHFDAHQDNYVKASAERVHSGNFTQQLSERDNLNFICGVGVRSYTLVQKHAMTHMKDKRVNIGPRMIRSGNWRERIDALPRVPVYVSIDADVIDPNMADEVNSPVIGGPTYDEVYAVLEHIQDSFEVVGMDLMEVADIPGKRINFSASYASNFISQILESKGGCYAI